MYVLEDATRDDLPAIMEIASLALTERYAPDFMLSLIEYGIVLVARSFVGGQIDGFCAATRTNQVEGRLLIIALRPNQQSRGIGGRLLRELEMRIRRGGAMTLTLEVREDNLRAIAFYRRKGYALVGKMPRYYQDGSQALLMRKGL